MKLTSTILFLGVILSGCGDGDHPAPEEVGATQEELMAANGISTNGISTNGISTNGISTNGISTNGTSLSGVSLSGTKFTGTNSSGQVITGSQFVGAIFTATRTDGSTYQLRIDSAAVGSGANSDVWYYGLSYLNGTVWTKLCVDAAGVQQLAIPLNGVWDYRSGVTGGGAFTPSTTSFTFSCRDASIGKCVDVLGYKPWKTVNGVNLTSHHVSCVRMLRADYCGDGKTWTSNGQQINVYDSLGIQTDGAAWVLEAEWTDAGARCITAETDTRVRQKHKVQPACFPAKINYFCGKNGWLFGGKLITEVP